MNVVKDSTLDEIRTEAAERSPSTIPGQKCNRKTEINEVPADKVYVLLLSLDGDISLKRNSVIHKDKNQTIR